MAIKANMTSAQLSKMLQQEAERRRQALIRTMLYCAEEVTNAARSTNSYKDQTGNLRSSVGSLVIVDGKVVKEYGFGRVNKGAQGVTDGQKFAQSLVKQYPTGIAIIVVAGKEYASYVADKGYDVLDSAENLASVIVPRLLVQLKAIK